MPDLALDTDVIIVGCGPVGAVAANFLGTHGVDCIVVERETTAHGQPRAFSCDDEALRIYQQIGLVEALRADMVSPERVDYTGVGGRKFAEIAVGDLDFGAGYSPLHFFYQPLLERTLRDGLARHRSVRLQLGHEVTALRQDAECVELDVTELASGARRTLRARHVLGCDGAHSPVRRLLGVPLVGKRYEEPWLAVSGLASEDAIRVPATTFVCDPRRPCFVGKGPAGDFRMEFMLQPGETPAQMERPEVIRRLVAPFVDPDRLEVRRAVVYRFGNAVAERWQVGRVLLLGDAAHQMPPFMGQGLVSGLRDVANLCWKLALVLRPGAGVDPALLASYEAERRPHVRAMADVSVRMGHVFLGRSPALARARDGLFRLLDRVPRARRFIRDFEFKPGPAISRGLIRGERRTGADAPEGSYFPQPRVLLSAGYRVLLDELLGPGFAVVGLDCDPRTLVGDAAPWTALGARFVQIVSPGTGALAGLASGEDESGRLAAWFRRHGACLAIVRPDRFVYGVAAATDARALARALVADLRLAPPADATPEREVGT